MSMTTEEIISAIDEYITMDVDYEFISLKNEDGTFKLGDSFTFDISNTDNKHHFAPYFKIESLQQAKEIFKEIASQITDSELENLFKNVMAEKNVDFNKEIYLSIYRPNRRKS